MAAINWFLEGYRYAKKFAGTTLADSPPTLTCACGGVLLANLGKNRQA
jgi:hypothetical protein